MTVRAIVVGGGIGGLTAAIALRRAGVDVSIYERAQELKERGAALGVTSNAVAALRALGIHGALEAQGAVVEVFRIHDARGRQIADIPMKELQQELGVPSVLFGVGLPDENAHAPDEKLDLGNFHNGIIASAFLYEEIANVT